MDRIELMDGKYTYLREGGSQSALRYGEPWQDLAGDKFVAAMADEILTLRAEVERLTRAQNPEVVSASEVCGRLAGACHQ